MNITLPELSLLILVGASGAGKSSFARKHFKPTEILSSDFCRGLVADDENDQAATVDAFDLLRYIAAKRLANGLLTVIDATNLRPEDRRVYVHLAREHHCLPVAIVLDLPERVCQDRNAGRPDRDFGPHVIRNQRRALHRHMGGRSGKGLKREGFRHVWALSSEEEVAAATVTRTPLWNNRRHEHGPFDIIGDVHGCFDELVELLEKLGYELKREERAAEGDWEVVAPVATPGPAERLRHPESEPDQADPDGTGVSRVREEAADPPRRKLIFLGDLVDRGPNTPAVLRLVIRLVREGKALCVPGNHDVKLLRKLNGKSVRIAHGLAATLEQLDREPPEFMEQVRAFIDSLISHYVLDDGRLVVAHAGLKQCMQGRASGAVREFCLYGETTGETDEFGLPVRYNWAAEYRGEAIVVYGHVAVPRAEWLNDTIDIDTGCVFGGSLTALRYPERELVSVAARRVYAESARPIEFEGGGTGVPPVTDEMPFRTGETPVPPVPPPLQHQHDDMLDLADVAGKRIIDTALQRAITIREENATAALEVMSRFAADPRWLIYLPPTMSPSETVPEDSPHAHMLEHPADALGYYRRRGVEEVVCQEKHMGSRAVVIICRTAHAARERFGVQDGAIGVCYTRTGRRFFDDEALEAAFLERVRSAAEGAGLFDELSTTWLCLDCELMPWSAKAQALIREQYAATGCAGRHALAAAVRELEIAAARIGAAPMPVLTPPLTDPMQAKVPVCAQLAQQVDRHRARLGAAESFTDAYRRYCWPVESLGDLSLAPFHLLASEGAVHTGRDHIWHMQTLARLSKGDDLLMATAHRRVPLADEGSCAAVIAWWEDLTARGGEGMVVKPREFLGSPRRGGGGDSQVEEGGPIQPAAERRAAQIQPAIKCRGPEYLRIIYGPEYLASENLSRLRRRNLRHKRSLALREFALGLEALDRFVRREPLRRTHECVFGVLALESEPVDPRL
jgi:protein phosphatase